jgi:hypothetical protein
MIEVCVTPGTQRKNLNNMLKHISISNKYVAGSDTRNMQWSHTRIKLGTCWSKCSCMRWFITLGTFWSNFSRLLSLFVFVRLLASTLWSRRQPGNLCFVSMLLSVNVLIYRGLSQGLTDYYIWLPPGWSKGLALLGKRKLTNPCSCKSPHCRMGWRRRFFSPSSKAWIIRALHGFYHRPFRKTTKSCFFWMTFFWCTW